VTLDALHTSEAIDPGHHTGDISSARPGYEGAELTCYLVRHQDPGPRGYQYDVIFEGKDLVRAANFRATPDGKFAKFVPLDPKLREAFRGEASKDAADGSRL
jgi:hypothetical protein